jgi:hypothetical protein
MLCVLLAMGVAGTLFAQEAEEEAVAEEQGTEAQAPKEESKWKFSGEFLTGIRFVAGEEFDNPYRMWGADSLNNPWVAQKKKPSFSLYNDWAEAPMLLGLRALYSDKTYGLVLATDIGIEETAKDDFPLWLKAKEIFGWYSFADDRLRVSAGLIDNTSEFWGDSGLGVRFTFKPLDSLTLGTMVNFDNIYKKKYGEEQDGYLTDADFTEKPMSDDGIWMLGNELLRRMVFAGKYTNDFFSIDIGLRMEETGDIRGLGYFDDRDGWASVTSELINQVEDKDALIGMHGHIGLSVKMPAGFTFWTYADLYNMGKLDKYGWVEMVQNVGYWGFWPWYLEAELKTTLFPGAITNPWWGSYVTKWDGETWEDSDLWGMGQGTQQPLYKNAPPHFWITLQAYGPLAGPFSVGIYNMIILWKDNFVEIAPIPWINWEHGNSYVRLSYKFQYKQFDGKYYQKAGPNDDLSDTGAWNTLSGGKPDPQIRHTIDLMYGVRF